MKPCMNKKNTAGPLVTGAATAPDGPGASRPHDDAVVLPFHRYTDFAGNWPVPGQREVLIVPLGGLGRIGMNWTLYGHAGTWLLVDAGIAFPSEAMAKANPDVSALIPDPAFLAPIRSRLAGLVLTHAHEDHMGAVDRLWPDTLDCPIWATPYAAAMLARRLEEAGVRDRVDVRTYPVGSRFSVGPFAIESVRVTHSIPEPVMLAITTQAGTVVHSGDWKFDPAPVIGETTDFAALKRIGKKGVLALICDSTNAHKEIPETSESHVQAAFAELFATRKGQVAICCFSSNVARFSSAALAAKKSGRHVALAGRSLRNAEETARDIGLLSAIPEFLAEPSHLKGLDRGKIALVCTGAQGEEKATLAKLVRGDWRLPAFGPGDTVVLSARVIPGNEASVDAIVKKLRARGIEVLQGTDSIGGHPLHVSGHPGAGELRSLYGMLKPRFALPVHGTEMHLDAHARLARAAGVSAAVVAEEAEMVRVGPDGIRVLGRVPAPIALLMNDEKGDRVPYSVANEKLVAGRA